MRKLVLVGLMSFAMWYAPQPKAYAGQFSDTLKNVGRYFFEPVNCVGNWLHAVGTDTVEGVMCIIQNLNRYPTDHSPIITTETDVDVVESPVAVEHDHE